MNSEYHAAAALPSLYCRAAVPLAFMNTAASHYLVNLGPLYTNAPPGPALSLDLMVELLMKVMQNWTTA